MRMPAAWLLSCQHSCPEQLLQPTTVSPAPTATLAIHPATAAPAARHHDTEPCPLPHPTPAGATLPSGHPQTPSSASPELELEEADALSKAEQEASAIVAMRAGQVLGQHTILKEDVFPLMQSKRVQQSVPGAPNFRGIKGFSVYGVGMSTVQVGTETAWPAQFCDGCRC
jgi:hypothetical protein